LGSQLTDVLLRTEMLLASYTKEESLGDFPSVSTVQVRHAQHGRDAASPSTKEERCGLPCLVTSSVIPDVTYVVHHP
jgi:hypothetical protein